MKTVLLCGGAGQRLWPLSRERYPKQFIELFGDHSLFDLTIKRNLELSNEFVIVTNEEQSLLAKNQINRFDKKLNHTFIIETVAKNTAPAITYAALTSNPEEILLVLPTDHFIKGQEVYNQAIKIAKTLAEAGNIVTFGIAPSRAETGYGYIEFDNEEVLSFKEKPDKKTAEEYFQSKKYLWNSGMFCFKVQTFLSEMEKYQPELLEKSHQALKKSNDGYIIDKEVINNMQSISIDYALMEKTQLIKVIELSLNWSDAGCFDELSKILPTENPNLIQQNAEDNYIYSTGDKLIGVVGVSDLVVIDDEDALLISKKGSTQLVKDVVQKAKEKLPKKIKYRNRDFRPWGYYDVLTESTGCKVKSIIVYPGKRLSLQKHTGRSEHWIVKKGVATVQVNEEVKDLATNEHIFIPVEATHRLENKTDQEIEVIEIQMGELFDEDDIIRIEDDYNR